MAAITIDAGEYQSMKTVLKKKDKQRRKEAAVRLMSATLFFLPVVGILLIINPGKNNQRVVIAEATPSTETIAATSSQESTSTTTVPEQVIEVAPIPVVLETPQDFATALQAFDEALNDRRFDLAEEHLKLAGRIGTAEQQHMLKGKRLLLQRQKGFYRQVTLR